MSEARRIETTGRASAENFDEVAWEVLYLLYDALSQLRKLTLSFSELRYLAVEHTEAEVRTAVEALLSPAATGGADQVPLITTVPNLPGLPIYRITPAGRELIESRRAFAGGGGREAR